MVLLFRFIGALIVGTSSRASLPSRRRSAHARVAERPRLNMHASSGRYISFMDAARVAMLVRFGAFRKVLARAGGRWSAAR